jgi:RHS repeat-associated protein
VGPFRKFDLRDLGRRPRAVAAGFVSLCVVLSSSFAWAQSVDDDFDKVTPDSGQGAVNSPLPPGLGEGRKGSGPDAARSVPPVLPPEVLNKGSDERISPVVSDGTVKSLKSVGKGGELRPVVGRPDGSSVSGVAQRKKGDPHPNGSPEGDGFSGVAVKKNVKAEAVPHPLTGTPGFTARGEVVPVVGTPEVPGALGASGARKAGQVLRQDENGTLIDNGNGTKTLSLSAKPVAAVDKKTKTAKVLSGKVKVDVDGGLVGESSAVPLRFGADGGAAKTSLLTFGEPGRRVRIGLEGAKGGPKPEVETMSRVKALYGRELDPTPVPGDVASANAAFDALPFRPTNDGPGRSIEKRGPTVEATRRVPVVEEVDVVRYVSLLPGVDVEYIASGDQVDEVVVLRQRPKDATPVVFQFNVETDGLILRSEPGGSVVFVDSAGKIAYRIPAPFAWDSSGADGASPKSSAAVAVRVGGGERKWTLTYTPDQAWLRDPARVYPVRIDPSVVLRDWQQNYPATVHNGPGSTPVGAYGSFFADEWKTFVKFDTSALNGYTVQSAQLNFSIGGCDNQYSPGGGFWHLNIIEPVASFWDIWNTTWPGPGVLADSRGFYPSGAWGHSVSVTPWVANWANGTWANNGFRFRTAEQGVYCTLVPGTAFSLDVTYIDPNPNTNDPPSVVVNGPADFSSSTAYPALSATASDPNGDLVQVWFRACTGSDAVSGQCVDSGWQAQSPSGTTFTWTPPAGSLAANVPYFWQALVAAGRRGPDSPIRRFTVVNNPPVVVQSGPNGVVISAYPTFSATVTDPEGEPVQAYFRICTGSDAESGTCINSGWSAVSPSGSSFTFTPPAQSLVNNTIYYWHVHAFSSAAVVAVPYSFTYVNQLPTAGLVSPPSGPRVPAIPTLTATASDTEGKPVSVKFQVCTGNDAEYGTCSYSSWSAFQPSGSTFTYVPSTISPTTWYWKAMVKDADGEFGPWSVVWSFNLNNAIPVATLATPPNLQRTTVTPTLTATVTDFDGDPVRLQFNVCNSVGSCVNSDWLPYGQTSWTVPVNTLYWNTTYFWAVIPADAGANGLWTSESRSFFTEAYDVVTDETSLGYPERVAFSAGFDAGGVVNDASGGFVRTDIDAAVATVGPGLAISRTYNSKDLTVGAFGGGWSSILDSRIQVQPATSSVIMYLPDGRREWRGKNPDNSYAVQKGYFSTFEITADPVKPYRLLTKDFTSYYFGAGATPRLLEIRDRNDRSLTITRNGAGQATLLTDSVSGRTLAIGYNGSGRVNTVTTQAPTAGQPPLQWTYTYIGNQLEKACDARGTTFCTTYFHVGGPMSKVTKARGNTDVEIGYSAGRVTSRKDGRGNITSYAYGVDADGIPTTTITYPGGGTVVEGYKNGALDYRKNQYNFTATWLYDYNGFVREMTNENGEKTSYENDARGNVTKMTDPLNRITLYTYYPASMVDRRSDRLNTQTRPRGGSTTYEYDAFGNTTKVTDPANLVTQMAYTTGGEAAVGAGATGSMPARLLLNTTDPTGAITKTEYDQKGNLRRMTEPSGLVIDFGVDDLGRRISESLNTNDRGVLTTTTTYDALSHPRIVQEPEAVNTVASSGGPEVKHRRQTEYIYNLNGLVENITVSDIGGMVPPDPSRLTVIEYDANDNEFRRTDPAGGVLTREFDVRNNVSAIIDQNLRRSETLYNPMNTAEKITVIGYVNPATTAVAARNIVVSTVTAFDKTGTRPTEQTDAKGRQRVLEYWADGSPKRIVLKNFVDAAGVTADLVENQYTYDLDGNADTESPYGWARKTTFDLAGRLSRSEVDPVGVNLASAYSYNVKGQLESVSTTQANQPGRTEQVRSEYDAVGRVSKQIVENGAFDLATVYLYNNRNIATTVTNARANSTSTSVDEYGRTLEVTAPQVNAVTYAAQTPTAVTPKVTNGYNTFGELTHRRDERGQITIFEYDKLGRQTKIIHPTYTPPVGPVLTAMTPNEVMIYDPVGNLTDKIDRRNNTTRFAFDSLNRPVKTTLPAVDSIVGVETMTYDDTGKVSTMTDPTGAVTTYTYDQLDHMKTKTVVVRATVAGTFSGSAVTSYGHHPSGALLWMRDPALNRTDYKVNAAGRTYETVDPLGYVTAVTHDQAGRVTVVKDPLGRTDESTFDLAGRLTKQERKTAAVAPAVGTTLSSISYGYDENGNRKTMTLPRGGTFTYYYDPLDRLIQVDQPTVPVITTTYGYDIAGAATRTTDGNTNNVWTTYNEWGLPEKLIEPSTTAHPAEADRSFVTAYDAAGNPVNETHPGGVAIGRVFDPLDRVKSETGTGAATGVNAAPNAARTFTYDLVGRLKSVNHATATPIAITYDDRGLAVSTTNPSGNSSYNYDVNGRMTKRVDASGASVFEWTTRNELFKATDPFSSTTSTFAWYADSSVNTVIRGGTTRTYGYDGIGRVTSDTLKNTASSVDLAKQTYRYDADGNVDQQVITLGANTGNGTHAYGYDLAGRLTSWTRAPAAATTYTYDGAGNRKTAGAATFNYDQRNRLLSSVSGGVTTSYSYTARGTMRQTVAGTATTNLVFDALGRNTTSGTSATATTFTYDGLDRVVTRKQGTAAVTTFKYAGLEADAASDGSGQFWARTPGGTAFAMNVGTATAVGAAAATYSVGQNRHGDLTHLFTTAGAYTLSRTYNPFGGVINTASVTGTAASVVPRFGYQGDYTDPTTGDVNMGARWYRPGAANFLSRDTYAGTLNTPVSLNRYTYANNSPLNFWDPTGRNVIPSVGDPEGWARAIAAMVAQTEYEIAARKDSSTFGPSSSAYTRALVAAQRAGIRDPKSAEMGSEFFAPVLRTDGTATRSFNAWVLQWVVEAAWDGLKFPMWSLDRDRLEEAGWTREQYSTFQRATAEIDSIDYKFFNSRAGNVGALMSIGLVIVGFVPVFGDALDLYGCADSLLSNGSGLDVGLNCGTVAPIMGIAPGLVKIGRIARKANKLSDAARASDELNDARRVIKAELDSATNTADDVVGAVCSFGGETRVLMADGSTKPISKVKSGDMVLAQDPETGEIGARKVTDAWVHDDDLVRLEIDGDIVRTTEDHPFWSDTDKQWQRADQLDSGDLVLTADGRRVKVGVLLSSAGRGSAYNLTVEGLHTYHVLFGDDAVLVHNACKPVNLPGYKKVQIDLDHVKSGHVAGGSRVSANKTLFPSSWSDGELASTIRSAYANGSRVASQGERVLVRGQANGFTIEMWVNKTTKTIETAYPVG